MLLSYIVGSRALVTYLESACPRSPEVKLWRVGWSWDGEEWCPQLGHTCWVQLTEFCFAY